MLTWRCCRRLFFEKLAGAASVLAVPVGGSLRAQPNRDDAITVLHPKRLRTPRLAAERVALGRPGDYKPSLALAPDGELLLAAFRPDFPVANGKVREDAILFRSQDGGRRWAGPEMPGIVGREPYLSVTSGGTLFATTHILPQDIRNPDSYFHSYLHRSKDRGRTWTTIRIGPDGFPERAETNTSRNVLHMRDGSLLLGVSDNYGNNLLWRSYDGGETWESSVRCTIEGVDGQFGLFGESMLWEGTSGKMFAIARVDAKRFPIAGSRPGFWMKGFEDNLDHLAVFALEDGGRIVRWLDNIGNYGQMYPSLLRLQGDRLLLTFTVRALQSPLGVRAVFGREAQGRLRFTFDSDQMVLDFKTPEGVPSGGGFGPTVKLADHTLVTAYSYRGRDGNTHLEVVRWRLPQ